MSRHPTPSRHLTSVASLAVIGSLIGTLLAPATATAGRAQAGGSMGPYFYYDPASGSTTGTSERNGSSGQVIQTFSADSYPWQVSIPFLDADRSVKVRVDSQGVVAGPDGIGQPFAGYRSAEANRIDGVLRVGGSSTYADFGSDVNGYKRGTFISSPGFGAEIFESFELRYDPGRIEPITVNLRFTIQGTMTGNQGDNGYVEGAQLYAILGNTSQGVGLQPGQSPVWRSETSRSGEFVDITGTVLGGPCSTAAAYCETFVTLYVGFDLRSRDVATGKIADFGGGSYAAPFGADFNAHMTLTISPEVTVRQLASGGGSEYEPLHAWVNPSAPVPEPAGWALLLAGAAGLGALARRRAPRPA